MAEGGPTDIEGMFNAVEWTIGNFSRWNENEVSIRSPGLTYTRVNRLELYPKGRDGRGEHLVVRVLLKELLNCSFELSFVGSDGSILCIQQVDVIESRRTFTLPPGPTFRDVVDRIRKNEGVHEDRLTLRWRTSKDLCVAESVRTDTITSNYVESFFKFSSAKFQNLHRSWFKWIRLPLLEPGLGGVGRIKVIKHDSSDSKFRLEIKPIGAKVSIFVRVSFLYHDRVVRTESNDNQFDEFGNLKMILSLHDGFSRKDGFSLLTHIKVVTKTRSIPLSFELSFEGYDAMPKFTSRHPFSSEEGGTVLSKELLSLYHDHDYSDFRIQCGGVSFPVHKNILSARSPVLKTMLSSDMVEAASGCMDIGDLDPPTLGLFLTYLYTGAVEDLQCDSALKLYYAADKYQVLSLKRECVDLLCANVSISNVEDILYLAEKHQDEQLISAAQDFVLKNEIIEGGFSEKEPSTDPVSSNQSENSVAVLTKDLMGLFQDQDFSDITLKCDNITFPVHKNILSARSPVFKPMLSIDMREAASGCMDIEDLDPSTLGLFLTYLYTGAVEDLQCDRALKLYYAANKYQVPSLKRECAKFLCANVTLWNVCDILSLADRHRDDYLARGARNFVLRNYSEVTKSYEWERFSSSEPSLALKTLHRFDKKDYVRDNVYSVQCLFPKD